MKTMGALHRANPESWSDPGSADLLWLILACTVPGCGALLLFSFSSS